jgi:hypothetical protein
MFASIRSAIASLEADIDAAVVSPAKRPPPATPPPPVLRADDGDGDSDDRLPSPVQNVSRVSSSAVPHSRRRERARRSANDAGEAWSGWAEPPDAMATAPNARCEPCVCLCLCLCL